MTEKEKIELLLKYHYNLISKANAHENVKIGFKIDELESEIESLLGLKELGR